MHVKDSGTVLLTNNDWDCYCGGEVSERIKQLWGLTYEELEKEVKNNNYRIITEDGPEITRTQNNSGETSVLGTEERSGVSGENGTED